MTREERKQAATDLAGILALGYDRHVEAHGPGSSFAIRTSDGGHYKVTGTVGPGAMSFVEYQGERYAVKVIPLGDQDGNDPLSAYTETGQ